MNSHAPGSLKRHHITLALRLRASELEEWLGGMQARAAAIGATLRVTSAVTGGTCVRLEMSM